ncbi:unnamed protein product [Cyprideis torosa]|uniref:C2HC/C3H-type domain-containing protein n=1 Tax=Cyprideis torosa TaxID=163714 RepID=A0A7R8W2H5_9CRUS|nr:unnamed protein product [Cyprideis torosa]CAG0881966.1 unnamed protein product [Cyprideis torosa]
MGNSPGSVAAGATGTDVPLAESIGARQYSTRDYMQEARFQAKQVEEKEKRLVAMLEAQQARQDDITSRKDSTSATSISSISTISSLGESLRIGGNVRKMFEERRKTGAPLKVTPIGWDKSYPLEPISANRTSSSRSDPSADRSKVPGRKAPGSVHSGTKGPTYNRTTEMRRAKSHQGLNKAALIQHTEEVNGSLSTSSPPSLNSRTSRKVKPATRKSKDRSTSQPPVASRGNNLRGRSKKRSPSRSPTRLSYEEEMKQKEEELMAKIRAQEEELKLIRTKNNVGPNDGAPHSPNKKIKDTSRAKPLPPKRPPKNNGHLSVDSSDQITTTPLKKAPPRTAAPKPVKTKPPPSTARSTAKTVNGSAKGTPSSPNSPNKEKFKPHGPPPEGMAQCKICGRNFNEDRIEKHIQICEKSAKKAAKRKTFDSEKKRVAGTEAEVYVKKGIHKKSPPVSKNKTDWRKKREEFVNAIREAKKVQAHLAAGGKLEDLPPPPPSDTSHYTPCPHCGRKFDEAVAERHIPKCANIKSNKK